MAGKAGVNTQQRIDDKELSDRQQEVAKRHRREASLTEPDDALEAYRTIEKETLDDILGKDDHFTDRLTRAGKALVPGLVGGGPLHHGKIVEAIRRKGDKLADHADSDLNKKLADFRPNASKRLKLLSLNSMKKFKRAAMRSQQALRVKHGVSFMRERWRSQLHRLREFNDALREVQGKTLRGHVPDLLSKEGRKRRKAEKETEEMMRVGTEAAQQVIDEERKVIDRHEEIMRERYAGERKLESKLRKMVADHLPDRLSELNAALIKAAQGEPDDLGDLRDALLNEPAKDAAGNYNPKAMTNLPNVMQEAFAGTFQQMIDTLKTGKTGDAYARFKAAEIVADEAKELVRLEPQAVLDTLKRKPIGTKLQISIDTCPSQSKKFTVLDKSPNELTLLPDTPNEPGEVVFVDFRRKAVMAPNYDDSKSEKVKVPDKTKKKGFRTETHRKIVTQEFPLADEGVVLALTA